MASSTTDRRIGLTADKSYKVPVTAATTANITLAGEQTIDGVAVLAINAAGYPDRVLVKDQTDPIENGIWDVATGPWTRSLDANTTQDLVKGSQVLIAGGTQLNQIYAISTTNPIIPGVSAINFILVTQIISPEQFGAVGDGVTNDGPAFRTAVAALGANGGMLRVPKPTVAYLVKAAVGDTSKTAVYIPDNVNIYFEGPSSPNVIPGENNTVLFRITGSNGGLHNVFADNRVTAFSNCCVLRLAPVDEADITTLSDIEFNNISDITARGFAEGIVLRPGPTVMGTDSYCFYNTFYDIDLRNNTLGIWLKEPPTQPGSGPNRNTFITVRCGETGSNTGVKIDAGDTNNWFSLNLEGIQSGTSPNTTPTGLQIAYNSATFGAVHNRFYGLTFEACTRSVDNDNDLTEFYGWFDATNTYYSPSSRALAVDIRGDGLSMVNANIRSLTLQCQSISTNRTPDITRGNGDFYTASGNAAIIIKSAASGVTECRLDTPGAYGYYSLYTAGTKAWSIGSQATGVNNITFFDALDATMMTLTPGVSFKPGADNTYDLGSGALRMKVIYAGTGAINTSDENEKTQICSIDEAIFKAWGKVNYSQFKFKNAVDEKSDGARWHVGLIAQRVKEAFESEGLNAFEFGLLCYDKWEDATEEVMEEIDITLDDGKVIKGMKPTGENRVVLKAGERYGIRYDEALALECAYLRKRIESTLSTPDFSMKGEKDE